MYSKSITIQCFSLFLLLGLAPSHCFAAAPDTELPDANNALNKTKPEEMKREVQYQSVEERRLYTLLQTERDNLENEKKVLALKEKELKTLQVEADKKLKLLDEKLTELKQIQIKIEELLTVKDAEELQKTQDLSLIYAKMTPDRAALALATIDEQLAADLLAGMKVKSAAKILDRMDKSKASQLSTIFTTIKVE